MGNGLEGIGRRIVLATHRRSGTHLTIDFLRRQLDACASWKHLGESLAELYLNIDRLIADRHRIDEPHARALLRRAPRPIVKTHGLPGFDAWRPRHGAFIDALLADADVYSIVRDGRDVLCSMHLYFQAFDSRARCPLPEFLRQERDGLTQPRAWAEHVLRWRGVSDVRSLRYEDVVAEPRASLTRLGSELGIPPSFREPLLPRRLRSVWEARWLRIASRRPPVTTVLGDASGRRHPVRWREAFTREDRAFFHREAGDALIELGYETSDAWVDDEPSGTPPAVR